VSSSRAVKPRNLDIVFRSCSRVHVVHGGSRAVAVTKSELIIRCLGTLLEAVLRGQNSHPQVLMNLTVIDDHSDESCLAQIQVLLRRFASVPSQILSLTDQTGNGPSLRRAFEFARDHARDLIYFVEDDYLHARSSITEMLDAFDQLKQVTGKEPVLFPTDYPDLYRRHYPSAIVLGARRYWRNIGHTTGTNWISREVLLKYWELYMRLSLYGIDPSVCEDNSINLIYREVPCFSPMPTLAMHLGPASVLSPYVDWKTWWDESAGYLS